MVDAMPEGMVEVNDHVLAVSLTGEFALDDPDADTGTAPSAKADRAAMYSVECRTCWDVPEAREQAMTRMGGRLVVADFAVNKRTGKWLVVYRPPFDDPSEDTLGLLVEHCRATLVSCPASPGDYYAPLGYGDPIEVDAAALAAARMLTGLGRSPWEAVGVYAEMIHAAGSPASATTP